MRRSIKNKKLQIIYFIPVLLLLFVATAYALLKQSDNNIPPDQTIITGTVSSYGDKYSFADGPVILTVDGKKIDTGGGLRASRVYGAFDEKAKIIGQKVKARVRVENTNGKTSYTIYQCRDCYIKAL